MPDNINFVIGGVVHKVIKQALATERNSIDKKELTALFTNEWKERTERVYLKEKDDIDKSATLALTLVDKFIDGYAVGKFGYDCVNYLPIGKDVQEPALEVGVEVPAINVLTGKPYEYDIELTGELDFVGYDSEGELVIIDHKTSARAYPYSKIYKEQQLPFYDVLLRIMIMLGMFPDVEKKKADAILYGVLLKTKKALNSEEWENFYQIQKRTIADGELHFFYDNLGGVIQGMKHGPYIACPGIQCETMCSHRPICDAIMRGENPITAYEKFMQEFEENLS